VVCATTRRDSSQLHCRTESTSQQFHGTLSKSAEPALSCHSKCIFQGGQQTSTLAFIIFSLSNNSIKPHNANRPNFPAASFPWLSSADLHQVNTRSHCEQIQAGRPVYQTTPIILHQKHTNAEPSQPDYHYRRARAGARARTDQGSPQSAVSADFRGQCSAAAACSYLAERQHRRTATGKVNSVSLTRTSRGRCTASTRPKAIRAC